MNAYVHVLVKYIYILRNISIDRKNFPPFFSEFFYFVKKNVEADKLNYIFRIEYGRKSSRKITVFSAET